MGLNPVDGYIYGLRYPASGAKVRLVIIGSGNPPNNVVDLGAINSSDLSNGDNVYAACFDADGTFYFTSDNDELFKIAGLNSPTVVLNATKVADISGSNGYMVDIAIDPTDGQMYGVSRYQDIYKINKTNGAITFIGTHTGSSVFGLFFDEIGGFYGYMSNGTFQKINKTNAALTQVGIGSSYTYADGCSCSFGRVFHELTSQKGICPGMGGINNPEWDITVTTINQSPSQKTGLTFTLDIPSNRFSFIETPATIAQRLFDAGLLPTNNALQVTIGAGTVPGTNNKIVITNFRTGAISSTISFDLKLKLTTLGGVYTPVSLQSKITGLPASLGSEDLSNDPTTNAPDDPSIVTFCANITLPVSLLNFSGTYKNNDALLSWEAENQVNFAYYDLERSTNGNDFSRIISKVSSKSGNERQQYQYTDDLSLASGSTFYYRLKMIDIDGSFKYSNIIMIRKGESPFKTLSISPNPAIGGKGATIRFGASESRIVTISVVDMTGRILLNQQNRVNEGMNSIPVSNLNRLQPGIYIIQLSNGDELSAIKFSVVR